MYDFSLNDVEKNETAITAICEKLSEVTILAEQLDTTLCGFKFAMESDSIKKLLETSDTSCQVGHATHGVNWIILCIIPFG